MATVTHRSRVRHWHVVENTPGYLPDSEPYTTASVGSARAYAQELADGYRQDSDGNYRVVGNHRDGYGISDRDRTHDLGRVIEIIECRESVCWAEIAS